MIKHLQKVILLMAMIMVPWLSQAQSLADYSFSTGVDATKWVTLSSSATTLFGAEEDDEASSVQNIGFTFPFGDGTYTQFSVSTNGIFRLGSTAATITTVGGQFTSSYYNQNLPKICGVAKDLGTGYNGGIYYELVGTAPSRTLVCEFRMGATYDSDEEADVKWQVQLHENGQLDLVYGPTTPSTTPTEYQTGLAEVSNDIVVIDPSTHTPNYSTSAYATTSSVWHGASRYYTFALPNYSCPKPTAISVANLAATSFDISWTDTSDATEWIVTLGYDTVTVENDALTNSYSFLGLEPSTTYTVSVAGICLSGDTSSARTITVRTPCVAYNVPYTQDFENFSTVVAEPLIDCWEKHTNYTTNYPYASTSQHHSGTKSMYMYSTGTTYSYAVLPQFNVSIDSLAFYCWMYKSNSTYPHMLYVGVMSDPADLTTFDTVGTIQCDAISTWEQKEVVFTSYTGTGSYIAILSPGNAYSYPYLDDVTVRLAPACATPTDVAVSDVTTDGATFTWSDASTTGQYVITLVSGTDTTIVTATDTTYTVTGLDGNTPYEYSIASLCSNGDTSNAALGTFRTACVLMDSLPYEMDFEGLATTTSSNVGSFVPCWAHLNNGTSYFGYPYISSTSTYNHTTGGARSLYWYASTTAGSYGDYQCVVLPGLDTTAVPMNTMQLKFWARATSTSYHPVFQVGVMTDPTDITTFQAVSTINVEGTDYSEYVTAFNTFTGNGNYVAIKANRPTSAWYAAMDDIKLDLLPSCPEVIDLAVDTVTPGSAVLTWDHSVADGTVEGYMVSFDSVGSTGTATVYYPTDSRVALTGLEAGTAYIVSVSSVCDDGGVGPASTLQFSTANLGCLEQDTASADTIIFSNSTTGISGCLANSAWGNTAYQTIYTAAELSAAGLAAGPINAIDLGFTAASSYAKELTIFLGNTTTTSISSATCESPANHTQVYGPANHPMGTSGWQHYEFDDPFVWDGSSSIILTTFMNQPTGSSHSSSSGLTGYYVSAANTARYRYQDGTAYTISNINGGNAGTTYSYRASIHFYSGQCIAHLECAAPVAELASVSANQVTLEWIPGYQETSWDVDYRIGTSGAWTNAETGTTDNYATITGLTANTNYQFRVSAICSDTTLSSVISTTTPCVALDSLPFSETFESVATGSSTTGSSFINCWNRLNNGTSYGGYPYVSSSSTYNHTLGGSKGLYWYNSTTTGTYGDYQCVVLPPVDTTIYPINTLQFTFWARSSSTSYSPVFYVGVLSDPNDISTFVPVDTINVGGNTTFTEYLTYFTHYTGNGNCIALRANRPSTSWYAYVDDFKLEVMPACPRVDDIVVDNITPNSADISWHEQGTGTSWTVVYNRQGNPSDSAVTVYATDTNVSLTGLISNSVYNVSITVDCGEEVGGTNEISFRTACGALTVLPYTENFEGYTTGSSSTTSSFIPCWIRLNNGTSYGGYPYLNNSTTYNHTTGGGAGLYWYNSITSGTYGDYQCIVLPGLDTDAVAINTVQLSFWAKASSTSYSPVFYVGVLSNPDSIESFQPVDTINVGNNTAWTEFVTEFSGFTGYGRHVAIKAVRPTSSWYAYVDDITLDLLPDCPAVENLTVHNITDNSAQIDFSEVGTASSWTILCLENGMPSDSAIIIYATDTTATLNGLQSNTQYQLTVTVDCGSQLGGSSQVIFRTACGLLDSLPYVMDFESEATGTSTTGGTFVNCWVRHNNGSSYGGYPYVSATSSYNHTTGGTKALYWYNTTTTGTYGDYAIAVLPGIDTTETPINTVQLSFWAKASSTSYNPVFYVGVMGDWSDVNSFQPVDTINVGSSTVWAEFTTYFSNFTGHGQHLAIKSVRPASVWTAYVDDVTIDLIPDCPPVTNIHLEGVDSNMLSVSWIENGDATSWTVEYGAHGFTPGTGTTGSVTAMPYVINGLTPNTQYDIYVTPDCSGTAPSVMATFRTANVYTTLPFSCNFEDTASYNLWSMANGTLTNQWHIGSAVNNGGANSLYISSDNGVSHNYNISSTTMVWAYTDVMLPAAGDYAYTFDWECYGESTLDYIRVALVPVSEDLVAGTSLPTGLGTTTTPSTWVALDGGSKLNLVSTWQTRSGDVHVSTPGVYHLAFGFRCDASVGTMPAPAIDNVEFMLLTCPKPTNIVASNVTQTSADMSWHEAGSATEWEYQVDTGAITSATDTNCTLLGLSANTSYTFRVRAICGDGDTSMWATYSFRTPCGNVAIPYTESFEGIATGTSTTGTSFAPCWTRLNNGTSYGGYPYVAASSSYAHTGTQGLYWYNSTTTGTYGDYQVIVLPPFDSTYSASQLQLNFWAKASSDSYQPQFKVGVMTDPNDLTTFVAVDTINVVGTTWTLFETPLTTYTGTGLYVALRADRGSSYWYAYVDDINLDLAPTCVRPTNVRENTALAASSTQLNVIWDTATVVEFQVQYGNRGFALGTGTTVTATNNYITLNGLTALTNYDVYVRKVCTVGDTSDWTSITLQTAMCDNVIQALSYDSTMSATTTTYAPIGYSFFNYGYVQTLIDSAQLAGMTEPISAWAFSSANGTQGNYYNHMDVYFANVPERTFSSTSFITPDTAHQFVQVLNDADLCYTDGGWHLTSLDTTFTWDGHSSILVTVNRRHGSYSSGATFNAHSTTNTRTLYAYNDGSAYSITSPTASTCYSLSMVGDMKFISCGSSCGAPAITGINQSYDQATITWTGSGAAYEVAMKEAAATIWPTEIAVAGNTYTFTGLTPATYYTFRVRQDCTADSMGYSEWVEQTFMTDSLPCLTPSNLTASNMTNAEATFDWTVNGNETNWDIHVWYGSFDSIYRVNAHPATVGGFTAGVTYNAAVRALCGTILLEGDWSDTITFTTATCPDVTGLATSNVTYSTVDLSWNANPMAQSWIIEYGNHGFNQGAGTTVTVNTNSYHVTGLLDETNYDFYVRAVCGTDWTSEGWASVSATTLIADVDSYYLTVLSSDPTMGTATGSGEYYYGETATMTATANEGYVFTGWNDGVTDNPRSVVILSDTTFTAMFQSEQQQGIDGINGISCTIYPNPATSSTTISVEGANGMVRIAVVDINGRTVASESIECSTDCAKTIDIDALAQGAYFVRITGENVNMVKKLIVR